MAWGQNRLQPPAQSWQQPPQQPQYPQQNGYANGYPGGEVQHQQPMPNGDQQASGSKFELKLSEDLDEDLKKQLEAMKEQADQLELHAHIIRAGLEAFLYRANCLVHSVRALVERRQELVPVAAGRKRGQMDVVLFGGLEVPHVLQESGPQLVRREGATPFHQVIEGFHGLLGLALALQDRRP